jgi:modulator of FtsH protease HflK
MTWRTALLYLLSALLVLLLVGYLLTGLVQVQPGERAVVRRFGRVLEHKPGPGLWIGLPWGMDRVECISVDTVRRVEVGFQPGTEDTGRETPPGQLLTGDHNLVNVRVVIAYNVRESQVEEYALQRSRVDTLVGRATEAAVAEWVGGRAVDEVLLQGQVRLRDWLVAEVQRRIEPYGLGVEIQQASVAHLLPPEQVKSAFDDVTRAQTDIQTTVNKAEQEAERVVREAQAERYRTLQLAAAYAREQQLVAQAEAKSFTDRLEQYRRLRQQNPDILRRIWLDEVSRLLARMKDGGQVDLLDNHLGGDGLDFTVVQPPPKKK